VAFGKFGEYKRFEEFKEREFRFSLHFSLACLGL
jgi:hypothetical protein